MEKRTPHYSLTEIQAIVATPTSRPFTVTALRGGLELGLSEPEMRQVVRALSRREFYKSMTTHADHTEWQDVYHGMTESGIAVYIKITAYTDGRPPVIQFKAK
jgi:motility quorum-sensing regulator / GCU-specific mRNA interferase toxin